jgi:hypothetical protein
MRLGGLLLREMASTVDGRVTHGDLVMLKLDHVCLILISALSGAIPPVLRYFPVPGTAAAQGVEPSHPPARSARRRRWHHGR